MDLTSLVRENKEFNSWKKDTESSIAARKTDMEQLNQQLDINEFKELGYDKAKKVFDAIQYNLEYNTQRKQVAEALEQLRAEKYPLLKVAHYYPVINEMSFISDELKHKLDDALFKFRNGYIQQHSRAWYDLNLTDELAEKVLEFLYSKGIVEKWYKVLCECEESGEYLSEQVYKDHQKYFELYNTGGLKTATSEELDWLDKFEESGARLWIIGCLEDCDGREINAMADIDENKILMYKLSAQPDLEYGSK